MHKELKKQIEKIKNAKTYKEAFELYEAVKYIARKQYEAKTSPYTKEYKETIKPFAKEVEKIRKAASKALLNWNWPEPDYSKMTKKELISIIERLKEDE